MCRVVNLSMLVDNERQGPGYLLHEFSFSVAHRFLAARPAVRALA